MWLCPKLGVFFSPLRPPEAWCFDLGTTMAHQHSRRPGGSSHHQYPEQSKTEEDVVIVGHRSGVYEVSCLVSRGIPVTRSVRSKRTTYHADLADTSTYPPPSTTLPPPPPSLNTVPFTVHCTRQLPQNNLVPLLLLPNFTHRTILLRLLVSLSLLVDERSIYALALP